MRIETAWQAGRKIHLGLRVPLWPNGDEWRAACLPRHWICYVGLRHPKEISCSKCLARIPRAAKISLELLGFDSELSFENLCVAGDLLEEMGSVEELKAINIQKAIVEPSPLQLRLIKEASHGEN